MWDAPWGTAPFSLIRSGHILCRKLSLSHWHSLPFASLTPVPDECALKGTFFSDMRYLHILQSYSQVKYRAGVSKEKLSYPSAPISIYNILCSFSKGIMQCTFGDLLLSLIWTLLNTHSLPRGYVPFSHPSWFPPSPKIYEGLWKGFHCCCSLVFMIGFLEFYSLVHIISIIWIQILNNTNMSGLNIREEQPFFMNKQCCLAQYLARSHWNTGMIWQVAFFPLRFDGVLHHNAKESMLLKATYFW